MSWPQAQAKRPLPPRGPPPPRLLPPPPPPPRAETQRKRTSAELLVNKSKCPRRQYLQEQITELEARIHATVSQGSCYLRFNHQYVMNVDMCCQCEARPSSNKIQSHSINDIQNHILWHAHVMLSSVNSVKRKQFAKSNWSLGG